MTGVGAPQQYPLESVANYLPRYADVRNIDDALHS